MPGAVKLNPDIVKPVTDLAYKDSNGRWHAGPDSGKFNQGDFVPEPYARKVRKTRRNVNLKKSIMRKQEVSEEEATEISQEFLKKMDEAESEEERRDIRKEYLGSP